MNLRDHPKLTRVVASSIVAELDMVSLLRADSHNLKHMLQPRILQMCPLVSLSEREMRNNSCSFRMIKSEQSYSRLCYLSLLPSVMFYFKGI